MPNRKTNLTNAFETQLTAQMSSTATSMSLDDVTGLVAPFYLVIEPDSGAQREYVYCDGLVGNTANVTERYLAGSAAGSGLTHASGAVVRMAALAQHIADANDRIDDLQAQINASGDHGGLGGLTDDDHTQYLTSARHAADGHAGVDHGGLAGIGDDDHPHYLNSARHNDAAHAAINHHAIAGLADDDHPHYLTAARHDADDHSAVEDFWTYGVSGELAVELGALEFPVPFNMTITSLKARVGTAPTGAAILIDINKGGASVLNTKLTIPAGSKVATSWAASDVTWDEDEYVTIDIDQVGSTVKGSDLTIVIVFTRR